MILQNSDLATEDAALTTFYPTCMPMGLRVVDESEALLSPRFCTAIHGDEV